MARMGLRGRQHKFFLGAAVMRTRKARACVKRIERHREMAGKWIWRSRPPHLRRLHGLDGHGVADPLPPVMSYLHCVMHGHGLDRETVLSNLHAREKEPLGEISH